MIRYSRSFFISIALHALSFGLLFVALKDITLKEKSQERVCLKLQEIQETKEIATKIQEPKKADIAPQPKHQKTEPLKQAVQKNTDVLKPKPLEEKIVKEEVTTEVQKIQEDSLLKSDFSLQQNHIVQNTNQNSPPPPPKESQIKDASQEYIELNTALIAKLIKENLSYPMSAKRQGITGVVLIRFNLNSDATISNIIVKESSHEILSRAATTTIEDLSQKLPKPSKDITLIIPIEYKLN